MVWLKRLSSCLEWIFNLSMDWYLFTDAGMSYTTVCYNGKCVLPSVLVVSYSSSQHPKLQVFDVAIKSLGHAGTHNRAFFNWRKQTFYSSNHLKIFHLKIKHLKE